MVRSSGQPVANPRPQDSKNKTLAILISLLLGPFAWVYTYEKDKRKFWFGLAVSTVVFVIFFLVILYQFEIFNRAIDSALESGSSNFETTFEETQNSMRMILMVIPLGLLQSAVWIWAIIDAVRRPTSWYDRYPNT